METKQRTSRAVADSRLGELDDFTLEYATDLAYDVEAIAQRPLTWTAADLIANAAEVIARDVEESFIGRGAEWGVPAFTAPRPDNPEDVADSLRLWARAAALVILRRDPEDKAHQLAQLRDELDMDRAALDAKVRRRDQLIRELSPVNRWAYLRRQAGFQTDSSVKRAIDSAAMLGTADDVLARFIADHAHVGAGNHVERSEFAARFNTWLEEKGSRRWKTSTISEHLRVYGVTERRMADGWQYVGIDLKSTGGTWQEHMNAAVAVARRAVAAAESNCELPFDEDAQDEADEPRAGLDYALATLLTRMAATGGIEATAPLAGASDVRVTFRHGGRSATFELSGGKNRYVCPKGTCADCDEDEWRNVDDLIDLLADVHRGKRKLP